MDAPILKMTIVDNMLPDGRVVVKAGSIHIAFFRTSTAEDLV